MTPRGIRLNNPGNLRRNGIPWLGLSPIQSDADFCEFIDPQHGIRAMAVNLHSYKREGICTIAACINRWAPPSENQTQAYIDAVSQAVGVDSGHIVDLDNIMQPLIKAIIQHEQGEQPYSDDLINQGIALCNVVTP